MKDRQNIRDELRYGLDNLVVQLNQSKNFSDRIGDGQYHMEEEQFDRSQDAMIVSYDNRNIRAGHKPKERPRRVILAEILLNDENLEAIVAGRYSLTTQKAAKKVGEFLHNFAHEHRLRNNVLHEY